MPGTLLLKIALVPPQQPHPPSEEEIREMRLRQLLQSLSQDEENLQLQQALDAAPPVHVEREW